MGQIRRSSLWTAVLLALGVGFVFFVLQDYGPESAVRRFHRAVRTRDARELQEVTVQPLDSWTVRNLVQEVAPLTQPPNQHRLVRMDREPRQVRAAVVYYFPDGRRVVRIWIVERVNRIWRIDAEKTLTALRDALELRAAP